MERYMARQVYIFLIHTGASFPLTSFQPWILSQLTLVPVELTRTTEQSEHAE